MKVNVRKFPLDFFEHEKNKTGSCQVGDEQETPKVKWGVRTSRKKRLSSDDRFKRNQQ